MDTKNLSLKKLIKTLSNKNFMDYIYLSIFFILFAVFIIFAIRPALVTAFRLKSEEKELIEKNQTYQRAIADASSNLLTLEDVRDKLFLIDQAIPDSPEINKVIEDISSANNQYFLNLRNIYVSERVDYLNPDKDFKEVRVNLETQGSFENIVNTINRINSQRRLKNINSLEIYSQSEVSTDSASLGIEAEIIGFYL